jgi:anti-sigma B factor antagonist
MVIHPNSGLDGSTVDGLRALVDQLPEDVAAVVVDLSQVDFIDSAALGVLVSLVRRTRERGAVTALAVPQSGIRAVLGDVGFDRVAIIVSSTQEAMGKVIANSCHHGSSPGPAEQAERPIRCGSVEVTVVRDQVGARGVNLPRPEEDDRRRRARGRIRRRPGHTVGQISDTG